jgi:hypothetical protein
MHQTVKIIYYHVINILRALASHFAPGPRNLRTGPGPKHLPGMPSSGAGTDRERSIDGLQWLESAGES